MGHLVLLLKQSNSRTRDCVCRQFWSIPSEGDYTLSLCSLFSVRFTAQDTRSPSWKGSL